MSRDKSKGDLALLRSEAVRRLMRDLKEIQTEPLPTISAVPSEDNIFSYAPLASFHLKVRYISLTMTS